MSRFNPLAPPFPSRLLEEIELARERTRQLASRDRQLHFTTDPEGHVVVELRTLDGRLVGVVPASAALDIINGADLDAALRRATSTDPSCEP